MGRTIAAAVCAVLATLALAAGGIAVYLNAQLLDGDRFADRAVTALDSPAVRRAVSERIVTEAIDRGDPDLAAARPLLVIAVESMLDSRPFESLARATLRNAHDVLVGSDGRDLAIDVANATALLRATLRSSDPKLARSLPARLDLQIAEVRQDQTAARILRAADTISYAAFLLPLLGVVLMVGAVWFAQDRELALRRTPLIVAAAAGLGALAERLAEPEAARAVGRLGVDELDAAINGVWTALVGDLRAWSLAVAIGGVASWALAEPRLRELSGRTASRLIGRAARIPRPARAALLALAGGALLIGSGSSSAARAVALLIGLVLFALGVADGLASVAPARGERRTTTTSRRSAAVAIAVSALVPVVAAIVLWPTVGDTRADRQSPVDERVSECNGSAQLCDRRLNEVVFPGTHNSMSAADRNGWLFANQRRAIPRQLADGIRLLMIDPHWGVRDEDGLVRTDLKAEGSNRNRASSALGPDAVALAERLVGRAGLGSVRGEREVYLCHTLCELGSERMRNTLADVGSFIDRRPGEVVILMLEPSVPAWAIEREFRAAGLLDRVATLDRARPLPTLRELTSRRRQIVVFGERDTGGLPWYHDTFTFIRDTKLGSEATSTCVTGRGDASSPLFALNNWVDSFPPPPSANGRASQRARLLARVRRCTALRGVRPSLIGVDWYDLGDVIEVARELNAEG